MKYVEQQASCELSLPFRCDCKMLYLQTKLLYIVFFLQCQNVQDNCQSRTIRVETRVVLIVFDGVLLHVRVYTATVAQHESGSRKALLGQ